jgi:hypothetical protein
MQPAYTIASIVLILILIGGAVHQDIQKKMAPKPAPKPSSPRPSGNYVPPPPAQQTSITASEEDYNRFERIMPQTDLVKDIPEAGKIQMSFFNFNTGYREWERDYILTTGSVTPGTADDADMKIILHSRNLPKLNADNVCEIFQQAKKQGDFGSELFISKIKFTWRYKSMMGYKSCLGF